MSIRARIVLAAACVTFFLVVIQSQSGERPSYGLPPGPSPAPPSSGQTEPAVDPAARLAGANPEWFQAVCEQIQGEEYHASVSAGELQAPNRAQNLRTYFRDGRIELVPRTGEEVAPWRFTWQTTRWGRPGNLMSVESEVVAASFDGPRVIYQYRDFTEWYENRKEGLEQGFTVHERPAGPGELRIHGAWSGATQAKLRVEEGAVDFLDEQGTRILRYGSLWVRDARGEEVPSRLALDGGELALVIDDADAEYPLTVDPLMTTPAWTAESDQADAWFGYSVATAGDVNGDGYSDVIVGAYQYDNGQTSEGRAYVYHGSAAGLSAAPAWTAESNQSLARFGVSVAPAGDVNGDGYGDVIVGAAYYSNGQTYEGQAFVYHGSTAGLSAAANWTAESNQAGAWFGMSVAPAGDVNGDGYSDVIIGAEHYDHGETDEGRAYVYHGSPAGLPAAANWTAESNQYNGLFGHSVATAGDVNGDGYSDVIVGAWEYNNGQNTEGRAFVYHGSAAGLSAAANWTAESNQAAAFFGYSVAGAGDVNGDGYSDVIVGSYQYDNGETDEGRAYVYHGSVAGLSAAANWTAESDQADARFGWSVATAGDVNGDGYSDVIVGAHYYDNGQSGEGRAYVYRGSAAGLSAAADWTAESDQAGAWFGHSVATAGDVNGDGYSDVIVGARNYSNGQDGEGRAFVYHGSGPGEVTTGAPNWTSGPLQAGSDFGFSAAVCGDVNGDGYGDVIAGAPKFDNGQTDEGIALLYLGGEHGVVASGWSIEGNQDYAYCGHSVAGAGDVNGDGYSDVLVGAYGRNSAYLFYGSAQGLAAQADWAGSDTGGEYGECVAAGGDVNGDGYGDFLVGAPAGNRVYVYWGSATGPVLERVLYGYDADEGFGEFLAGGGDVNGDGFSDILIANPYFDQNGENCGGVWMYYGSHSGVGVDWDWGWRGLNPNVGVGWSVGFAGDVNGDGFSDILVPEHGVYYPRARLFLGQPGGPTYDAVWTATTTSGNGSVGPAGDVNSDGYSDFLLPVNPFLIPAQHLKFGSATGIPSAASVVLDAASYPMGNATAVGDVNGDGVSDIVFGSQGADGGQVRIYYGNGTGVLTRVPRQARTNDTAPIAILGMSDSESGFLVKTLGRTAAGRGKVRLQCEVKEFGVMFDASGLVTGPVMDTGVPSASGSAVELALLINSLAPATPYHWRLRVLGGSPYFPYSRWFSMPDNAINEADFRTWEPPPVCSVVPTMLDFGEVVAGQSSDRSFIISNSGGGTLIGNVSETCGAYSLVSGGGPFSLTAGQVREVTVRFTPPAPGSYPCTIETGQAICSDIACAGSGVPPPLCTISPSALDFGQVPVGEPVDLSFVITNAGGGVLSGDVSESCDAYSLISGGGPFSLSTGQSREVSLRFIPPAVGEYPCNVETGQAICSDVTCTGWGCATFTALPPTLPPLKDGGADWGDYDGDGDLDLALVGYTGSANFAAIYRNDAGAFVDAGMSLPAVRYSGVTWGDYDGDSDLDLLLFGDTGSGSITRIYRKDGGTFADIGAGLTGVAYGSAAWGDYDNDGDLDILLAGFTGTAYVCIVYRNDAGAFTNISAALTGVGYCSVAWGDYDNDGDLDILEAGSTGTAYRTRIYRNDGGAFTNVGGGLVWVGYCTVDWGDYDGDGDLDVLLAGYTGTSPVSAIYRNDGGTFADIGAGLVGLRDCSGEWGDYDNDGDLDVLLAGFDGTSSASRVYRNDGGSFTDSGSNLIGIRNGVAVWGDHDRDGDLDVLVMGASDAGGVVAGLYGNNTRRANTAPTVPGGPSAQVVGTNVTLSWSAASDDQTPGAGLSYNLRIGTTSGGGEVCPAMANAADGYRRVVRLGNAQKRTSWAVRVPGEGGYYWSVQAVDGAYAGSPFAATGIIRVPFAGTQTVGPTGRFPSLTAAFAAIQTAGVGDSLVLELQPTYVSTVETFPLTAGLFPGSGPDNTVTIRPASGATGLSITSNSATGTFDLNGATYVVIDGRPGGTGTSRELTIENTNVTGWALRFRNDARNNLVEYSVMRGVTTSTSSGVVVFGTTTGTTGNDDNTIDQCDLRDGATPPTNMVYSSGTSGKDNSGNIVSGCSIYNFFNATSSHAGISLSSNNQNWTIRENSFYETAARNMTGTGTLEWQAVASSGTATNGLQIIGNYMGGTAPQCGGGPLTYTGNATLRALRLTVGTTTPTSVQGNVFRNIAVTSSSASSSQSLIGLVSGSFNVGTETPNEIGRQDATGSISFTLSNTSTASFAAISAGTGTPGTIVIANNLIGGVGVSGQGGVGSATVRGISLSGTGGQFTITNNTVGSPSVGNSFTNATTGAMAGIYSSATSQSQVISGNSIADLTQQGTSGSVGSLIGISAPGNAGGAFTIRGNTVRNLTSVSSRTGSGSTASVIGISLTASTTAGQTVAENRIYGLSNTTPTAAVAVVGIYYSGPNSGTNEVARNLVHSLPLVTTGHATGHRDYQICGLWLEGGSVNVLNNMIRLGRDAGGNSVIGGYPIAGILDASTPNHVLGNSVFVGGNQVVSDRNTVAFRSRDVPQDRRYHDNAFVNARSNASGPGRNFAVHYERVYGGLYSDYNDLYVSGVGGVLGATGDAQSGDPLVEYATLGAWRAGTGRDQWSISADPIFVNAEGDATSGDLHVRTDIYPVSPVTNAGVTMGMLTDDFDGEARGPEPDIGADEYPNYTLTASAGAHGTISPAGTLLVNGGTNFTFTITPAPCYVADVVVDGSSVGPVPSYTFTNIQTNHTIAASFAPAQYTLTTSVVGGGTVTRVPDLSLYPCGSSVEITAHAGTGWQFDHWTGGASGNANPLTVVMNSNLDITAVFVDVAPPEVQVTAPNGGEIWEVGSSQAITWTATDNAGVTSVDLAYSTDGGATYPFVIAAGQANTGSHPWVVPDTPSTTARVRVTAHDAADLAAADASDADFEIRTAGSGVAEALLGAEGVLAVCPNPTASGVQVAFRAAAPGFLRLSVYDVAGREVRTLHAEHAAAGVRSVIWDGRDVNHALVPTGIYLVRLDGGPGTRAVRRLVIAR